MSQKIYTDLDIKGNTTIGSIANATTDTDKFLVSDNGLVKYRTGAEMLSDLGVAPGVASNVQHQVKAGVAINKGQAVYVTSADGTNMIVGLASNASEATSSKTMGLLDATVAINGFANVVTEGLLAGLNTSTAAAGDPVWLGTGGNLIYGLINKPYAPAHLVFIGIVTRSNLNNGEIFVKVQNGFELNEIHDADLKTTTPVNGHILGHNGTLWVNKTIAGWLGYTPANASGTLNKVAKFTSTGTTLGDSQIFDNGTNVLIGTTTDNNYGKLRVSGGAILIDNNQQINSYNSSGMALAILKVDTSNKLVFNPLWGQALTGYSFTINGSEKMSISTGGSVTAIADMRAPIFYDLDNTAYYLDPASTSNISKLLLNGAPASSEASLSLGAEGVNEGGQLILNKATSYTYAAHLDVWQDVFRVLYGSNTASTGGVLSLNLASRQLVLHGYTSATSYTGTAVANLAVDTSGNVITVAAGGSSGVSSIIAGTGVSVSSSTGAVTVSIGQSVATSATPSFDQVFTTNNGNGTNLKIGDDAWIGDYNVVNSIKVKGQQDATAGYISFGSGTEALGRIGTGMLTWGGNTIWNAGNDGSGSGLDADLLDGLHASDFALASHTHPYDNYQYWNLKTNGVQRTTITSNGTLDLVAGTNVSLSYGAGGVVTISSTDTNTIYTHPAYTTRSIDTSGAQVIDVFTSDAIGSVTNITTRTMTLADLGYTGATNANFYTLPTATSTVLGGIELFSDTVQTVAANAVSATASRTYGLQLNAAGQAVVNVPWTDTVYTHPAYTARNIDTSGAQVIDIITSDAIGSVTNITTRNLTPGDIGAADASHTHTFDSLTAKTGGTGTYQTSGEFIQNNGRYVRDSYYRTISGRSDLYTSGTDGWYTAAQITLSSNCGGAVLYGTLYDHRYNGADSYQIAVVARSECDFTSNNQSHYVNVGCTIIGSTNNIDYKGKIRVILTTSTTDNRTYQLQFYETAWNSDTWQLESNGWTIYTGPQTAGAQVGTPIVNYVSNLNADYLRANTSAHSPIYYDSNNTAYYTDPSSTSNLLGLTVTNTITGNISGTAGSLLSYQSNWASTSTPTNVVGLLGWKNYGNSHVIFDASASTTPSGTSCSNTNPQNNWSATYPTLMGWNGANTYGVRVDSARVADSASSAGSVDFNNLTNKTGGTGNYITSGDFRAPFFYDSNDTSYYGDFASTSRQYQAISFGDSSRYSAINTTINGAGAGDKLILYGGASNYDARLLVGADYDMLFKSQGNVSGKGSFKFYSGVSSALAMLIDASQNTTVYGSATANSFVKSGGTSAQILAADGSVITAGTNITISGGVISSTDTNTIYTHPAYTARSIDTSGAQVIDVFTSDAIGSVTNITTRTMTLADLGYTGATNANFYTLPTATSTVLGGVKLFSDTVQSTIANAVSATASRTYGVQVNAAGQMLVNVPWTDTVYTHPAYTARSIDTSGAQVIDIITSDAIGSITNITTRTMTLADIGAASSTHTHDLVRYSLAAPANIDSLTTANFRTTLFGSTTNGYQISTARWNSVPTPLTGLNAYGTMFAWAGSDTQGFIAMDYSAAALIVGGGNADNINWSRRVLVEQSWTNSKYFDTGGEIYGTRFYDANNSTYYLDPADTTKSLNVAGKVTVNLGSSSGSPVIEATTTYGNMSINTYYGVFHTSGDFYIGLPASSGNNLYGNQARFGSFIDRNNSAYYLTPSSTSVLNRLSISFNDATYQSGIAVTNTNTGAQAIAGLSMFSGAHNGSINMFSSGYMDILNQNTTNGAIQFRPRATVSMNIDNVSSTSRVTIGSSNTASHPLRVTQQVSNVSIYADYDIVAYSDQSVKENIRPIENVLDRVNKSRGVVYDRIDSGEKNNIGFIAQELEVEFPELVVTNEDNTKAVKYQNAVAVLFEAVKEQQKQIEELKELVNKLITK
jgi:hypothetical protein